MQQIHIFDLDGTVVNSELRVKPCLKPNGDLDLDMYKREACTHEKIQTDTLLPLAKYMQSLMQQGAKVIVCTARHMSKSDYVFLRKNKLRPALILSRDQLHKHFTHDKVIEIYNSGDAAYKGAYFDLLRTKFKGEFIMYDDHKGVLAAAQKRGFSIVDAVQMNQILDKMYEVGYIDGLDDSDSEIDSLVDDICYQLSGA